MTIALHSPIAVGQFHLCCVVLHIVIVFAAKIDTKQNSISMNTKEIVITPCVCSRKQNSAAMQVDIEIGLVVDSIIYYTC